MKIVLAPDSFKGNMTSMEVAVAFEKGIKRVLSDANCIKVPMADGGEGTVQSLVNGVGGKFIRKRVVGPIGKTVSARYGLLSDGKTAVIEMAEASGLPLVTHKKMNPMKTTTFGTGEGIFLLPTLVNLKFSPSNPSMHRLWMSYPAPRHLKISTRLM